MVQVHFTNHLRHVAPKGGVSAAGATIRAVLADVFARHPALKGYILDDQERLRVHIAVFLDGEHVRGPDTLERAVKPDSELYILQALSGG
ncbi:MAG: MoaD/ThiS family protein [Rhodospirillaceae bacterium]|nr:MoaD/ThiS family protein [Rhodospirillaceae bacterium]